MKKNKVSFLCLFLMFAVPALWALDVEVTNSAEDIVSNKKIWLHIALGPQEAGVLKRTVQFSVDQPELLLSAWHPLVQWRPLFLPSFKKTKAMITVSFAGWLAIDFSVVDDVFARQVIEHARLQMSCLVLHKNGKTVPTNVSVLLDKKGTLGTPKIQSGDHVVAQQQSRFFVPEIHVKGGRRSAPVLDTEFTMFDSLGRVWAMLISFLVSFIQFKDMVIVLLFLGFLLLAFRVRQRSWLVRKVFVLPPHWKRDIGELFVFVLSGGFVYFIVPLVSRSYAFYAGSLFCCLSMAYLFWATRSEVTFWLRLKSLVGFGMGVLVLPLLLKGYLLQCGL